MTDRDPGTSPEAGAGLGTRYGSADQSPGLLLWRVTNRWQATIRAALKPHGLTHVQYVLLASLGYHRNRSGPAEGTPDLSQAELAAFAGTDVMMTSQVLRALEQRGLVDRRPDPADGRVRLVSLTAAGAGLARAATTDVEDADEAFFAALGDGHRQFAAHLRRLDAR